MRKSIVDGILHRTRACAIICARDRWEGQPALRRGLCLFRGQLRERECEAELRGTHSQAELGNDIGLMGALLPFVLRVVAGACVGRGSGQPRMPPRERQHEGLGGDWGILSHVLERCDEYYALFVFLVLWGALLPFVLRVVAGACVGRGSGQPRMPPRERQHEGLGGLGDCFTCSGAMRRVLCAFCFFGFVGGAVAVCFEGCCGSMCWPRERPATHAAAGAAARGALIFCFGDCFTRPELGNDRGFGFVGALLPFVLRVVAGACVGRGSGQPRMPPRERQHEGL